MKKDRNKNFNKSFILLISIILIGSINCDTIDTKSDPLQKIVTLAKDVLLTGNNLRSGGNSDTIQNKIPLLLNTFSTQTQPQPTMKATTTSTTRNTAFNNN